MPDIQSRREVEEIEGNLLEIMERVRESEEPDPIKFPLLKQITTNILQCFILRRALWTSATREFDESATRALAILDDVVAMLGVAKHPTWLASGQSAFVAAVADLARCVIYHAKSNRNLAEERALAERAKASLAEARSVPQMPYDNERFALMGELLGRLSDRP